MAIMSVIIGDGRMSGTVAGLCGIKKTENKLKKT